MQETLFYSLLKHPLVGEMLLVANQSHLIGSYYTDAKNAPTPQKEWRRDPKHPVLAQALGQLREYLNGDRKELTVSLQLNGTDFQRKIWTEVIHIPSGTILSYTELAKKAGVPTAIRSVGAAIGKNPLLIFVPDHRVISQSGSFGGFSGKWNRKPGLLELEGHSTDDLPKFQPGA